MVSGYDAFRSAYIFHGPHRERAFPILLRLAIPFAVARPRWRTVICLRPVPKSSTSARPYRRRWIAINGRRFFSKRSGSSGDRNQPRGQFDLRNARPSRSNRAASRCSLETRRTYKQRCNQGRVYGPVQSANVVVRMKRRVSSDPPEKAPR